MSQLASPTTVYPPHHIHNNDKSVNVLQLTDLHLYLDTNKKTAGINNQQSFDNCLHQALNDNIHCDLILLTGDLVNEVKSKIYDRIFDQLEKTGIPFACIAGNHDVTDELNTHLAYKKHEYVAHTRDSRLLSRHIIKANNWHILLVDSSVPGHVYGYLGKENIEWLQQTLAIIHTPVIIAMHHHVLPMTSSWINQHITKDADDFWQVVTMYSNIKAVITGHVHQKYETDYCNTWVYATPSTCYQFKPNCNDFTLDVNAQPGYRWLQLDQEGKIKSWIRRLTA